MTSLNLSTRELDRTRLKLRDDLIVRPLPEAQGVTYQIEDPVAVRFYRVGRAEYLLISLLDGRTTLAEAVMTSARELGNEAFTEHEATSICLWLIETGLATPTEGSVSRPQESIQLSKWFNPFWMKVPLLKPERILDSLRPFLGWFFSAPAFFAALLLWAIAGISIAGHAEEFWRDSREIFSSHNWLLLAAVWIALKIVHEIGHGLCCRIYGGRVTEMGVVFVLFAPMAYVDVTSTWSFRSRWRRMHVAAAGIQVELTVAAVAALLWTQAAHPVVRHLLHNIVISASLTTLVFNMNPLMRFDGYFILEDILDLPNLATTSQKWLQSRWGRVFYGDHRHVPVPAGLHGWVIRLYAVLSSLWRLMVSASLLTGVSAMFRGAGLILAIGAIAVWYVKPALEWMMSQHHRWKRNRWSVVRAVVLGCAVIGALSSFIFVIPSPFQRQAPGVVDYAELQVVRVISPGFVDAVHVVNGEVVDAGTPLITLRNEELLSRVTDLELAIEQSESRRVNLMNRRELGQAQIELRNQQALLEQIAEVRMRAETLVLRSPIQGRVLARKLNDQLGNYMKEGTEVLLIGDDSQKEILASIDQRDLEAFRAQAASARVRIIGTQLSTSVGTTMEPRASTKLPHPALSAVQGGHIDVVTSTGHDKNHEMQLVEPRFQLRVPLGAEESKKAFAGQYAMASPPHSHITISQQLQSMAREWGQSLVDPH